jgi:hypothetical protein
MASHARIEGGKRLDVVPEVAGWRWRVGGALDSGFDLKLFELALDFKGRPPRRDLPRTRGSGNVGVRLRAAITSRREKRKNNDRPNEKMVAS